MINTLKKSVFLLATSLLFLGISSIACAGELFFNGFVQGNYSANLETSNPNGDDFKWAEEKVQIKIGGDKDPFYLFLKIDLSYDHLDDETDLELREGYIDYLSESWDLRVGRQIITWGVGDLIFINDIFPKDYEAFFSGRPLEYLKIGSDAVKIGIYPRFISAELVIIPFFESNNSPKRGRFWMFDPMPHITNRHEEEPITNLGNTELALRIYRNLIDYDVSLYFYKGFFRQSSMLPNNIPSPTKITLFYPELSVYGASLQGRVMNGIISFEVGYYDSRQDRKGTDSMIPNSQTRFLIGYQRQLWEDFTIGLQYYGAYMHDYSEYETNLPEGFPKEKRFHDLMTIRLTQLLRHQTLKVSFFSFWGLSEGDYMIIPEVKYNFSDHIWAALGANIFGGGEEWSQFGSLDKNDIIYTIIRYEF